jgi:hypothetical protein
LPEKQVDLLPKLAVFEGLAPVIAPDIKIKVLAIADGAASAFIGPVTLPRVPRQYLSNRID